MLGPIIAAALGAAAPAAPGPRDGLEVGAGVSTLVSLAAFEGRLDTALEARVDGPLGASPWRWGAGARLGLGHVRPEGFVRLTAVPLAGRWQPALGVEAGVTARARFGGAPLGLLTEMQTASTRGVGPLYAALHATPLRWRVGRGWRLEVLSLQVGTQLAPLGGVLRLQLGLLSVGVAR